MDDDAPALDFYLRDPTRLATLAKTGLLDSAPEPSYDRLTRLVAKFLGAPVALISLVDNERQFFKSCIGLPEPWAVRRETPLTHSFCQHVIVSRNPFIINDARVDPRVQDNLAIPDLGVIAYLGIPLVVEGHVIGSLCAIDGKPRDWSADDIETLQDIAESVVTEIRFRADHATIEQQRKETESDRLRLQVTLSSIGDAVITTDAYGIVTFLNPVAEFLCGWASEVAVGRPLETVFRIINEQTRQPVENPVSKVIARDGTVGLANYTRLIAQDGTDRPIEDSAAPIRNAAGDIDGVVLVFRDASERRQQQREIEDRERLFSTLAESIPQLAWMADPGGFVFWYNSRWYEYTGTTSEQMLGWGWTAVHDPAILPRVVERITRSFSTGEPFEMIFPIKGADDVFRPFLTQMVPVKDQAGQITRWLGTNTDITDAKRAEDELRDARSRLEHALSAGFVATFSWDIPNDRFVGDANMTSFYSIPPEELSGGPVQSYLNAIHPDDRAPVAEALSKSIESGESFEEQYRIVRDDGPERWVVGRAAFQRDDQGRSVVMSGVILDVTERKLAEQIVQQSEERYRALFSSMGEGFCILQIKFDEADHPVDYRFLEVNPAFERLTRLVNPTGRWVSELMPGVDREWHERYGRIVRTGVDEHFELKEASLGGRSFAVYAFRIGEQVDQKVAVLFNDITHRKRNELEREQLVSQLTEADRRKDEFLAMLAHELRNPLGAIQSGVMLVKTDQKPEVLDQIKDMIDRQTRHLTHLIDDLLDVSRLATGKIILKKQTVELGHIIARTIDQVRTIVEEKRHELTISKPDQAVLFVADPTRAEQILGNLLTNAAKYTPTGGRIHLDAKQVGEEIVCTITDNGVGISAEMLPKVFALFTQIDSSIDRSQGGLGIGLTLVRNLTEMHGGRVAARSDGPGMGSVFTVTLPIGEPEPIDQAPATPKAIAATQVMHRILIVDDNRDTAKMTSRLLAHRGYKMLVAHDGYEGIEAARAFHPHVILLDIGLPGMNGYEVATTLRHEPCCRESVIVAVSGYGESAARERSRQAGFDHHLTKPLDFDHLGEILQGTVIREPAES